MIKTKKGRQVTISPENDIIVKRANQSLIITIPDYPAQIANVGDNVNFSLPNLNGLLSSITWDFGDGQSFTCNTRSCATTPHIYIQAGTYTIRATVTYTDQPSIDGTINLKVQ
ncbi:TPA: hypothetical protein DCZ39_06795 [Patescibacteria group bacterium]|nr:hypothetical protein [Candidatus Gracilibacteria bacterium]